MPPVEPAAVVAVATLAFVAVGAAGAVVAVAAATGAVVAVAAGGGVTVAVSPQAESSNPPTIKSGKIDETRFIEVPPKNLIRARSNMARKLIVASDFINRAYSARRNDTAYNGKTGSQATHAKYSLTSFGERRDDAPPT